MANDLRVELRGVEGLRARLRNLLAAQRRHTGDVVAEALLLIETDAKLLSPVDTGLNRAEIHADQAADRLSGAVSAHTDYAIRLEFGTRATPARPFLYPAYEKHRARFLRRLKQAPKLF